MKFLSALSFLALMFAMAFGTLGLMGIPDNWIVPVVVVDVVGLALFMANVDKIMGFITLFMRDDKE